MGTDASTRDTTTAITYRSNRQSKARHWADVKQSHCPAKEQNFTRGARAIKPLRGYIVQLEEGNVAGLTGLELAALTY